MSDLVTFGVIGLVIGAAYAIAASGLVITYATSNVFNMAHGAVGMVMAFVYWDLNANRGLPKLLALVLTLVIAAAFGALIERTMMRRLTDASATVSLTVTVGLLVVLIGVAQTIWPPAGRSVEAFFPDTRFRVGALNVSGHDLLTFILAAGVAAGLYYLLTHTRTGIAMRAVVDNRDLVALHGARPHRLGQLSWALGSALAALAGVLLVGAGTVQLDYFTMTLLVVNAYAAAMVGRLKNLPRTFVGAMLLGLAYSYFLLGQSYLDRVGGLSGFLEEYGSLISGARAAVPTIFLFVVMLLLPHGRLRVGQVSGASLVAVPSWRKALAWGALLLVAVTALTGVLSTVNTARLGQGLALSLIMLSLVVLTGYGGDVSLGQMTFVGIGALMVARYSPWSPTFNPLSILLAGLLAAGVGALVAIPALRLRGLYLGLGTLAFAVAVDEMWFKLKWGFSLGGSASVERPTWLGMSFASERAFTLLVATAFVAMGLLVLWIRRGRFGRFILATRDSPAACGTLGLSPTVTRVALFTVSAGMAGVAGAMYAGMYVSTGAPSFQMFQSLPLLLLAVVGGITSVTGALLGGLLFGLQPILSDTFPQVEGIVYLLIGAAAVALGRQPNGIAGWLFKLGGRPARDAPPAPEPRAAEELAPEEVGLVAAP